MLQSQIIVLCLQIDIGQQQLILDHLPEDSGHFISVHLYERGCHFDLFHNDFLSGINFRSIIF